MSIRGLLVGAVLLVVLGGLVWWSERQRAEEEAKGPAETAKVVAMKDDEVDKVEILRRAEPPTVVEKDKSSGWQLTAPKPLRVDSDAVTALVSTFTTLTQDRVVEEKGADLQQFGLSDPAVQVGVTAKGGKKRVLLIGDETPTGGGFFAKLDGDPKIFTITNSVKTGLDKSWSDLRDKRLLTFSEEKIKSVELNARGTVEFTKAGEGEWQITRPRPLRADTFAVEDLVRKLKEARMEEEAKGGVKVATVRVTDASGTQTLDVLKSGEEYFGRSSVTEGVYKIAKETGDALMKGLDDFRNKKLFDFGFADPSKIDIRDGDKQYHFVKGGEKWWSNGKEMDPTSVQSLIDKLRDLSAAKFVEGGFTTPVLELNVKSTRDEKVAIAKVGERYLAKRENDATIYEVDGKHVEELQRAAADVKAPPPPPPATPAK